MSHNLGEILGCSIVRVLLPMSEPICASVDDAVKVRCPVRCGGDNCLCLVRGVCWLKTKKLGEQRETDPVCLWWTHPLVNRKRTDAAQRVNRKKLLGLRGSPKKSVAAVRHDAPRI